VTARRQDERDTGHPTDGEFEAIVSTWEPDIAECVRTQRRDLTRHGVTREPMRTYMACCFAEVILQRRLTDVVGLSFEGLLR
jgi:hypothetical protein